MSATGRSIDSTSYSDQAVTLARRTGILFVAISLVLVVLEAFEAAGVLSNPVQGGISFALTLFAAVAVIGSGLRLRTSARLHWGVYILIATGALYMLISWTEDLPVLNDVLILGRNDKMYRKMTKIMLLATWFSSPPFLALNMITQHRQMTDELEDRIADRTQRLSEANARLQSEIRHHVVTGNELQEAQVKLASLVEVRSQQLAVAEQELFRHERLKALGTMASGVAHELNNALAPIQAFVELLLRSDGLKKEQVAWLQNVDQATADAVHVIHSLQQFHGKGASHSSRTSLDPANLIRQVVDLTRSVWKDATEAAGKRIQVQALVEPNLTICANASEIRQVLTNLILNSVDAIRDEGTITLELKSVDGTAEFRVIDDGDGLDAEQLSACMEPFFTTKPGGTGLGLSVCSGIVQNHGGRLRVESTTTGETIFGFNLPLVGRDQLHVDAPRQDRTVSNKRPSLRVLYVEDNAAVRRAFAALLDLFCVEVVLAESGKQAIAIVEDSVDFDLLIVDMGMPDMNGAETIIALKDQGLRCPSLVVSGWSVRSVIDRFGQQSPPDFILTKPVSIEDLEQTLDKVRRT